VTTTLEPYAGDPAADAGGARTPPGQRVVKVSTAPPGDRCARLQALLQVLVDAGLRGRPAVLFLAHVARETGYGEDVWNWNVGNLKEWADGPWYRHSGQPYSAFGSALEGAHAAIAFLDRARYAEARRRLMAGDASWYGELGLAGYYGDGAVTPATVARVQAEYDSALRHVEACDLTTTTRIPVLTGLRVALGFGLAGLAGWLWKGTAAA
jgi:hypothetical protein